MNLDVPEDIVARAEANESDLLFAMAIGLYADKRIDLVQACRLARISPPTLTRELVSRGIVVHLAPDDPCRQAG